MQRERAEARVTERQKRVEERAIAAARREAEFAAEQAAREASKASLSEAVQVGSSEESPGERSQEILKEMRRTGQINAAQYEQASIKIKLTTERHGAVEAEPQVAPEALLVGRRSPKLIVPDLEPARKIVWPDTSAEQSRWSLPTSGSP